MSKAVIPMYKTITVVAMATSDNGIQLNTVTLIKSHKINAMILKISTQNNWDTFTIHDANVFVL